MYIIEYKKGVDKQIRKIPKIILKGIIKKIEKLSVNPQPNGAIKLRGSSNYYRIRHLDYRVIYAIEHNILTIYILKIDHRREVYKSL